MCIVNSIPMEQVMSSTYDKDNEFIWQGKDEEEACKNFENFMIETAKECCSSMFYDRPNAELDVLYYSDSKMIEI